MVDLEDGVTSTLGHTVFQLAMISIPGSPLPTLSWWRRSKSSSPPTKQLLPTDDVRTEQTTSSSPSRVTSKIRLQSLQRGDLGDEIGCEASNNDIKEPLETSFKINMMREWIFLLLLLNRSSVKKSYSSLSVPPVRAMIVREWSYFLAGKPYNVTCQVKGSNPAAYTKAFIGGKELKVSNYEVRTKRILTVLAPILFTNG